MKISVIIPAHNAEPYVAQAIESCLRQTCLPEEIIVVDDGSTDGTAEIAQSYPSPVRVLRLQENMGVSVARNEGVAAATGDWLAFLDADDQFLPDKLELQQRQIFANPVAVLIYAGFRIIGLNAIEQIGRYYPPCELEWRLRYHMCLLQSTVLLRKDAFLSIGGFDPALRAAQDWDLCLRILNRFTSEGFAAVEKPLVLYCRTPGSLSSNPMRYFNLRHGIIEKQSLHRATGISKTLLRRRIEAFNAWDTAIAVRENGSAEDISFMLKSLILWPLPGKMLRMKRYKFALVMSMQHLGLWPNRLKRASSNGKFPFLQMGKNIDAPVIAPQVRSGEPRA